MTKVVYGIGDYVFLVDGPVRTGRADGEYRIVGRLPDTGGYAQYRIQSKSETFERRIVATEIDSDRSKGPHLAQGAESAADSKESWLKPSTIKVHK